MIAFLNIIRCHSMFEKFRDTTFFGDYKCRQISKNKYEYIHLSLLGILRFSSTGIIRLAQRFTNFCHFSIVGLRIRTSFSFLKLKLETLLVIVYILAQQYCDHQSVSNIFPHFEYKQALGTMIIDQSKLRLYLRPKMKIVLSNRCNFVFASNQRK